GMLGQVPLLSVFTVDATTLPALKGLAEGVISGAMWNASLENEASKAFVKSYQEKYGRIPSQYSASGYDAANLLGAAIESLDGKVADKTQFAKAVKNAGSNFQSVRGPFKFNNNNMPIQNFYAFLVEKTDDGARMKHIDTPLKNHKDAYHNECRLK
ncbi:MAG: ABC transporter substrate-binding protein, partial [Pusillimonas sp.]|nr:ABC transporter substrate-binding protein [Pusillimonas sp.]